MIATLPVWSALLVPVALAALAAFAATLDAHQAARAAGHPRSLAVALVTPLRAATRLLLQQRRRTLAPDAVLWRVGAGSAVLVAALMLALVPFGRSVVFDSPVGLVWFNALDVQMWALMWLAGWGPNAQLSLSGGYRFLVQALSYELPLMFALTAPAIAARSLSVSAIVSAQYPLWFVVWMPVSFLAFLLGVLGFSMWGPLSHPLGDDLAGGVSSELAGVDRLLFAVGRYALLAAGAAFAGAVFLGGGQGPLLPAWLWSLVKTLVVLALLVSVRGRLPVMRMERFTELAWVLLIPATLAQLLLVTLFVLFGIL